MMRRVVCVRVVHAATSALRGVLLVLVVLCVSRPATVSGQASGAIQSSDPVAMSNTESHRLTAANGRTYTLFVHLPVDYATSDTTSYPVLYLTDAELEVMAMYVGIADFLRVTNRIGDLILVGIADGAGREHRTLRQLDYTPTRRTPDDTGSGGGDAFLTFVRDRAMPFVEARYRADATDRGFFGYSYGGVLGAHALLNRPDMFQRYLLVSPVVGWDDRLLVRQAEAHADAMSATIYTAFGADERPANLEAWDAFLAALRSADHPDLVLSAERIPNADHTLVMPTAFLRGMVVLYGR